MTLFDFWSVGIPFFLLAFRVGERKTWERDVGERCGREMWEREGGRKRGVK